MERPAAQAPRGAGGILDHPAVDRTTAWIVTVGDEILRGDIVDTNASYLAEALTRLGVDVARKVSVVDDEAIIAAVVADASARANWVLVTGGLGPTTDDLTAASVARAMGVALVRDAGAEAHVRGVFERRGRALVEANLKQADLPEGARMLDNPIGTAPGFALAGEAGARGWVVCMPGVPVELRRMFTEQVVPAAVERFGLNAAAPRRIYRILGLGESAVQQRIGGTLDAFASTLSRGGVRVQYRAHMPEVWVALQGTLDARGEYPSTEALAAADGPLQDALGPSLYGVGTASLAARIVGALRTAECTLGLAESCTGGGVAALLTAVPGASACVAGSIVAYTHGAKTALLDVEAELLDREGAVSEAVAGAMAVGARARLDARIAVAVTGFAGPDAGEGEDASEVGTIHFALWDGTQLRHRTFQYPGDRARVTKIATHGALRMVWDWLVEHGLAHFAEHHTADSAHIATRS